MKRRAYASQYKFNTYLLYVNIDDLDILKGLVQLVGFDVLDGVNNFKA